MEFMAGSNNKCLGAILDNDEYNTPPPIEAACNGLSDNRRSYSVNGLRIQPGIGSEILTQAVT